MKEMFVSDTGKLIVLRYIIFVEVSNDLITESLTIKAGNSKQSVEKIIKELKRLAKKQKKTFVHQIIDTWENRK